MQPLRSQDSPNKGRKSEVAASPLPNRGAKRGWHCYVIPVSSGIPKQGEKTKTGSLTQAFLGGSKEDGIAT